MIRNRNVRNTTKFKRSIKAISPVIATLLMIAIAVVASLVVYAWVTGYMGNTTSKAGKAIQIQSFAISGSNLIVYVQNVGQGDVALNKDQSVYVDSILVPITLPATATIPINAQDTVELTLPLPPDYVQGHSLNIKVTTTDGTFMTATGIPKTTNPTTPATTYPVNFVLGTPGGLSMNPTGSQTVGGTIAITATENSGYHFTSWSSSTGSITFGDDSLASTSATINGAGTVTANFAADTVQYSVTFAMSGDASAVISPTGTHSYDAGSSVPITATASSGYHFTSWSSSTGSITFGDDSLASTSATINGAGTVTANFAADTVQYSVTFAMSGDASAVISPTGTHSYDAGSSVPITATASSGYHFTSWSSSTGSITFGDDSLASTSATINGAGTVTANFAADTVQYSVTFAMSGDASAVISPTGTHSYDAGSSVPITATASSGYHFTSWSSSTGSITFGDDSLASTSATINGAGTVTANFAVNTPLTMILRPNGAGSNEALDEDYSTLANWECVKDVSSDSDTTYVYNGGSTSYRDDTYQLQDHGSLTGTISSVQVFMVCKKYGTDGSNSYAETIIRVGSTNTYSSGNALGGSYQSYSSIAYTTKPGGTSWTWTDIDNLQAGVSLRSGDTSGSTVSIARCTQMWVVVTYTPA